MDYLFSTTRSDRPGDPGGSFNFVNCLSLNQFVIFISADTCVRSIAFSVCHELTRITGEASLIGDQLKPGLPITRDGSREEDLGPAVAAAIPRGCSQRN
jgi:hypothetical protein